MNIWKNQRNHWRFQVFLNSQVQHRKIFQTSSVAQVCDNSSWKVLQHFSFAMQLFCCKNFWFSFYKYQRSISACQKTFCWFFTVRLWNESFCLKVTHSIMTHPSLSHYCGNEWPMKWEKIDLAPFWINSKFIWTKLEIFNKFLSRGIINLSERSFQINQSELTNRFSDISNFFKKEKCQKLQKISRGNQPITPMSSKWPMKMRHGYMGFFSDQWQRPFILSTFQRTVMPYDSYGMSHTVSQWEGEKWLKR